MPYRVLTEFEGLFRGQPYRHRDSSRGDFVAIHLYEDLVDLGRSEKLVARVSAGERVLNTRNKRRGVTSRRGDATFGEIVPGTASNSVAGFAVGRGEIATVEVGVETKILAKAMIKQIDRVIGNLRDQVDQFRRGGEQPICVAFVGINHATHATSYEGERANPTDGRQNRHPIQEAAEAERRLRRDAAPVYDEFIVLHYIATNEDPFEFSWVNPVETERDYAAALVRISREYDRRF